MNVAVNAACIASKRMPATSVVAKGSGMAEASSVPVIASGGVGCMADLLALLALEPHGVSGVIVGRALYDGRVMLREGIEAVKAGRLQDPTSNLESMA